MTRSASLGGTSIYGPLSAPIVLLIWLYMLAIAVLIGAALNAGIRNLWPSSEQRGLRERFAFWLRPPTPGPTSDDGDDSGTATDDDLDLDGIRDAARRPLTPISDDETLVIPRIRVGSGR